MLNVTYYHAGCPVCVAAERTLVAALDPLRFRVTPIHLGHDASALPAAKAVGVTSVPALVIDGQVFHLNFGASLQDLGG